MTPNAWVLDTQRWVDAVQCFLNSEMSQDWFECTSTMSQKERSNLMANMLQVFNLVIVENKLAALADCWRELKRLGLVPQSEFSLSDAEWLQKTGIKGYSMNEAFNVPKFKFTGEPLEAARVRIEDWRFGLAAEGYSYLPLTSADEVWLQSIHISPR